MEQKEPLIYLNNTTMKHMETKQTPVEWLEIELEKLWVQKYLSPITVKPLLEQAKAMEKQHVMEFLEEYDSYIFRGGNTSEEEYYNYIYGQ